MAMREDAVHIGIIDTLAGPDGRAALREAAYGLLRRMAAELTGLPERELETGAAPSGKPVFTAHPEIHFSLSHSGPLAACALARFPVGLDVEVITARRGWREIAHRWFAEREYIFLERRGDGALESFYHLWTEKEAWLKLHGHPIWKIGETPDATGSRDPELSRFAWTGGHPVRFSLSLCARPPRPDPVILFPTPYLSAGIAPGPVPPGSLPGA